MSSPFNASGNFQTTAPFFVSDKERGLDITLADGPGGRMEDAHGLGFHKTIEVRFSNKRIWIPCFTHNERYTFNFRGEERFSAYISIFSIPIDIAKIAFSNQFKFIFDKYPSGGEAQQFWSDIKASINLFLEIDRSCYEERVANPSKPRFILFDYGLPTPHVSWTDLNWREIATRALTVMAAAREA